MTPVFRHGRLRLYLLRLLDEEPRHGYEVIRLLRDRFMGVYAPSPGTIYPRLARLEDEGLVTHDEENGRKVYRITEAGREELRSRGAELDELEEELSESVSDIVREFGEDVTGHRPQPARGADQGRPRGAAAPSATPPATGAEPPASRPARAPGAARAGPAGQGARLGAGPAGPRARPAGAGRGVRATPSGCARRPPSCATTPASSGAAAGATGASGATGPTSRAGWPATRPRRAARLRAPGEGLRHRPARGRLGLGHVLGSESSPPCATSSPTPWTASAPRSSTSTAPPPARHRRHPGPPAPRTPAGAQPPEPRGTPEPLPEPRAGARRAPGKLQPAAAACRGRLRRVRGPQPRRRA